MRESGVEIPKVKTTKMAESACKQRIVLDMSYDDLMSDKVRLYILFFILFINPSPVNKNIIIIKYFMLLGFMQVFKSNIEVLWYES